MATGGPHKYEHDVDLRRQSASAHVVHLVGQNKRVLDVGCGPGSITRVLVEQGGCRVTAVERDADAIAQVRPYCESVVQADLNSEDWPRRLDGTERFDVIVAADVLEHLYDPWQTLRRMTTLLAPQGYLVISLPHAGHAAVASCVLDSDFDYQDVGLLDRTHIRFFGLRNMETLFAQAGLKIVEARYVLRHPQDTEFEARWEKLPYSIRKTLTRRAHAYVYQVVSRLVRVTDPGEPVALAAPPPPRTPLTLRSLKARLGERLSPELKERIRNGLRALGIRI
jgi:2-polyprenyl-3-methyl-5-hydroxy-6-metoxy-1,4-benzoquinol methylase